MRVTCDRDQILSSVRLAYKLRGQKKTTNPSLDCVQFNVGGEGFYMRMTDLETQIKQSLAAEVSEEGGTLLPLRWALNALPVCEKLVTIESKGVMVTVRSGLATFELAVPPFEDYPVDDFDADPDKESTATLEAKVFYEALRQTLPAVSYDETRYFLCGVYLDVLKTGLNMVATDGRRLAVVGVPFSWRYLAGESAILPTKAAKLMRVLAKSSNVVELSVQANRVRAVFCGTEIKAKTDVRDEAGREYPDYENLMPHWDPSDCGALTAGRQALNRAVQRMNTTADETTTRLRFHLKNGEPKIISHSEKASANEAIQGTYEGKPLDIGISGKYVNAALNAFKAKVVTVKFIEALRPWVIESNEDNLRYLIMPMRIDDY